MSREWCIEQVRDHARPVAEACHIIISSSDGVGGWGEVGSADVIAASG